MARPQEKIIQYLEEARATELALVQTLQAHIAMTPGGKYRRGLEKHLRETRDHAKRVEQRLEALGRDRSTLQSGVGLVQGIVGQAIALGKGPLDLLHGTGGEEKLLKNAKDEIASEALEIATYTALEQLAVAVDDAETAQLAKEIRRQEERAQATLMEALPELTADVVRAEIEGKQSYDISRTGAAQAAKAAGRGARRATNGAQKRARQEARRARRVPGVAQVEGEIKGAVAGEKDLPIANYGSLNAQQIVARLGDLSQIDLAKVDAYERRHDNRRTVLQKIDALRGEEPWPGYDEQSVEDIRKELTGADERRLQQVRSYERAHKDRAGVVEATEREPAGAR